MPLCAHFTDVENSEAKRKGWARESLGLKLGFLGLLMSVKTWV